MKISEFKDLEKSINELEKMRLEGWEIENIALNYLSQGRINVRLKRKEDKKDEK